MIIKKLMNLKEGDTFYKYTVGHTYKCHVVAILNEEVPQIVYKHFGISKQWWHYTVESIDCLAIWFEVKPGKKPLAAIKLEDVKEQY